MSDCTSQDFMAVLYTQIHAPWVALLPRHVPCRHVPVAVQAGPNLTYRQLRQSM